MRCAFDARRADLDALCLSVELDPIARHGKGSHYTSSIEATLRWPDANVHDVVFLNVVDQGRLVINMETIDLWIRETIDETIAEAGVCEDQGTAD